MHFTEWKCELQVTKEWQKVINNPGSRISNPAFLAFKTSPVRMFSYGLKPVGSKFSLGSPESPVVLGSHKLNSDEALGLCSALFLSTEWFHALILSFVCLVSMEMQALETAKPCTTLQTPCVILGISKVNTTQHVGVNLSLG